MGKLIKYELRKQRTSRLVILAALAVGLLTFWGGLLFDNSNVMGVTIALMFGAAILVLFYTGIEGVLVLNRDLRTRQSYMLWMVPKSVWKEEGFEAIVEAAQLMSRAFVEGGIQWEDLVGAAFLIFLAWSLVILIGFLAVILARTVLVRSRFAGLFAVILFFIINYIVGRGYDLMYQIPGIAGLSDGGSLIGLYVWDVLYYLVICGIVFIASSLVADKKLSV